MIAVPFPSQVELPEPGGLFTKLTGEVVVTQVNSAGRDVVTLGVDYRVIANVEVPAKIEVRAQREGTGAKRAASA